MQRTGIRTASGAMASRTSRLRVRRQTAWSAAIGVALLMISVHLAAAVHRSPGSVATTTHEGRSWVSDVVLGSREWNEGVRVGDPVIQTWPGGAGMDIAVAERVVGVPDTWPPVPWLPWLLATALLAVAALLRVFVLPGAPFMLVAGVAVTQHEMLGVAASPVGVLLLPIPALIATLAVDFKWRTGPGRVITGVAVMAMSLVALVVGLHAIGWSPAWTASWLIPITLVAWTSLVGTVSTVRAWHRAPPRQRGLRALVAELAPAGRRSKRAGAEEERDRLAVAVHEFALPHVHASLRALQSDDREVSKGRLRELEAGLRDLLNEHQLTVLHAGGLGGALQGPLAELNGWGLRTELRPMVAARRPPLDVEVAAYRVAQESLTNVWLHASADRVIVEIVTGPDHLHLVVADDGIGLEDPAYAQTGREGHLGVREMHRRAREVGASLQIAAGRDGGTRVAFVWRR